MKEETVKITLLFIVQEIETIQQRTMQIILAELTEELQHIILYMIIQLQGYGNIKEGGYFGDSTLAACPTVKEGAECQITKCIQQRLLNRGYTSLKSKGGADGVFGRGNTIVIKDLQRNKGLSVDGIVSKNTWKALYIKRKI